MTAMTDIYYILDFCHPMKEVWDSGANACLASNPPLTFLAVLTLGMLLSPSVD